MNNIYAEADEILRTNNKKAIVSILLSMQGNYLRAREAEDKLTEARAEIESKSRLVEQMRDALRQALPEARSTHAEQTILAALAAERGR